VKYFRNLGFRHILLDTWYHAARKRLAVPGLLDSSFDVFKSQMRGLIPVPWTHRGRPEVAVVLKQGESLKEHEHPEWTLLYYVTFGNHERGTVWIDDKAHIVEADSAVLLNPGVKHEVKAVPSSLRFSVAFRVYDHDDWTLHARG